MATQAAKIAGLQTAIGHNFQDADIAWEALQAPGSGIFQVGARPIPDGNKRLVLLGDAVLKLVLVGQNYDQGLSKGKANTLLSF